MIAIDLTVLDIEARNFQLNEETNTVEADGVVHVPFETATAYYTLPPRVRDYIKDCQDKYGVVGFEYDLENDPYTFGIVIRAGEKEATNA